MTKRAKREIMWMAYHKSYGWMPWLWAESKKVCTSVFAREGYDLYETTARRVALTEYNPRKRVKK